MMDIIHGIELGESGAILKYKTHDDFFSIYGIKECKTVDRRGCLITLWHFADLITIELMFLNVEDAKTFMSWLAV